MLGMELLGGEHHCFHVANVDIQGVPKLPDDVPGVPPQSLMPLSVTKFHPGILFLQATFP